MVYRSINFEGINVLHYVPSYLEDGKIPSRLSPLTTNSRHISIEKYLVPKGSYSE